MSKQEENSAEMNSSNTVPLSTLARDLSLKRSQKFLLELVNLRRDDEWAEKRFRTNFPDFVSGELDLSGEERGGYRSTRTITVECFVDKGFPNQARLALETIWKLASTRDREAELLSALDTLLNVGRVVSMCEPERAVSSGNVAAAVFQALKFCDRMRVCGNPKCPAPFFLAKRRTQKYCSEACSGPSQRECKRRWWEEHGEQWRRERKKLKAKRRKSAQR